MQRGKRMERAIVVLSLLSGLAFVIGQSISFIIARASASETIQRQHRGVHACFRSIKRERGGRLSENLFVLRKEYQYGSTENILRVITYHGAEISGVGQP